MHVIEKLAFCAPTSTHQTTCTHPLLSLAGTCCDALAALTNEVSELKAKNADLAEQFLRAKADAQNTMRRAEEEMAKNTRRWKRAELTAPVASVAM